MGPACSEGSLQYIQYSTLKVGLRHMGDGGVTPITARDLGVCVFFFPPSRLGGVTIPRGGFTGEASIAPQLRTQSILPSIFSPSLSLLSKSAMRARITASDSRMSFEIAFLSIDT